MITWEITNKVLEYFGGKTISFDTYKNEFVIPVDKFYLKYCPNVSMENIDEYFFENYISYDNRYKLFEGIPELIETLNSNNTLYILSTLDFKILNKHGKEIGILKNFKKIIGNASNKIKALEKLLIDEKLIPSETIFIGDMPYDIESAQKLKVQSGGVTYGYSNSKTINSTKPDYVFNNSNDIHNHFIKINQTESIKWPIVTVGGIILNEKNQILLIKTSKWSGLYGTPGGKVDYGESLETALKREIKEETNLSIKDINFVFYQDCIEHPEFYKPSHFLLMNFIAHVDPGKVSLNYESENYRWEKIENALKLPLNTPTKNLILELQNRKKEFINEYNFNN
jgi:nucleoside triphosphatase